MNPPVHLPPPLPAAPPARRDLLEARFAARLTVKLNQSAQALPHEVTERLRFAREHALTLAQRRRRLQPAAVASGLSVSGRQAAWVVHSARGYGAAPTEPSLWGLRLVSLLPLVLLVLGLLLIQQHVEDEQVQAAADVDAALLADELPPDAYIDPGFQEYLRLHSANR